MRRLLLLGVALVAALAAWPAAPAAAASTVRLSPTVTGWYQPNLTCALPTGCLPLPALPLDIPLSAYPKGTMHVAVAPGQETARTYLAFRSSSIEGTLVGATLEIPLDRRATSGTLRPETANVQVCLATGTITATEGSVGTPPTAVCPAVVKMVYEGGANPRLRADLKPFLAGVPTTQGLLLLPVPPKTGDTAAWHVAFATSAPVLTLTVEPDADPDEALDETEPPLVDVAFPNLEVDPGLFEPSVAPSLEPEPAPAVDAPPLAARRVANDGGYPYPLAWAFPLLLALGVPLAVRAFTTDMTPRRSGNVS